MPEVDSRVRVEEAAVPPITSGTVAEVVIVGVVIVGEDARTAEPVPVIALI